MTQGEIGADISAAISLNHGLFQELQAVAKRQKELTAPSRPIVRDLSSDTIEGQFRELPPIAQRALPEPQTERQKRVSRYRNKRRSTNHF